MTTDTDDTRVECCFCVYRSLPEKMKKIEVLVRGERHETFADEHCHEHNRTKTARALISIGPALTSDFRSKRGVTRTVTEPPT